MLNHLKLPRKLRKGLLIWVFLLLSSICTISYAEDICFTEPIAKKMVVELEVKQSLTEQIDLYKQANNELEYQVKLLKEINTLQKTQVDQYKDLVKIQKEGYESIIKESKPSFLHEATKVLGFIGIGILIGLVL